MTSSAEVLPEHIKVSRDGGSGYFKVKSQSSSSTWHDLILVIKQTCRIAHAMSLTIPAYHADICLKFFTINHNDSGPHYQPNTENIITSPLTKI